MLSKDFGKKMDGEDGIADDKKNTDGFDEAVPGTPDKETTHAIAFEMSPGSPSTKNDEHARGS